VYAERLIGSHGAIDEAPHGTAAIAVSKLIEDTAFLPPAEDLFLEGGMVRNWWKLSEHAGSQCNARTAVTLQEASPLPYGLVMISSI
jgi:hypothetical protein